MDDQGRVSSSLDMRIGVVQVNSLARAFNEEVCCDHVEVMVPANKDNLILASFDSEIPCRAMKKNLSI